MIILAASLFVVAGVIWLFFNYGLDKIKNPEEWKDTGSAGERILYKTLVRKFEIPEEQIFRNVYVPRGGGKTAEIDLVVVSRKGIFAFECKNYGGNVYGDARRTKWVQHLGGKKSYFYSPLMQNRNHAKYLREFLARFGVDVPIVPVASIISRGTWKIRNLGERDYILGVNCHLKDIYKNMPDCEDMARNFKTILREVGAISRPDSEIREEHVRQIRKR